MSLAVPLIRFHFSQDENDLRTVKADKDCSPDVSGENRERREYRRKREWKEERQRECKKHLSEEFTANPRGVLWLRVQVELQGFLGYLRSTYPVVRLVKGRKRLRQPERKSLVENAFPTKLTSKPTGSASNMQIPPNHQPPPHRQMPVSFHTPVHLPGTQRATSSYCLWPRPLIPFNAACTTTKGDKLGRRLDDRVTNPFGKTNSISGPYSWTS